MGVAGAIEGVPACARNEEEGEAEAARTARDEDQGGPPSGDAPQAAWLIELNSLCRHGRIELEAISRPSQLSGIVPYLRQAGRLNRRLNDRGLALVRRSGNATVANQLQELFDRDEAAVQRMLTLAEKGQYQQLARFAQSLVPLARAENRMLMRLGAVDCTVLPDDYRL